MKKLLLLSLLFCSTAAYAQTETKPFALYDGTVVAGYVDKSAFLNFMGPTIKATKGPSVFMFGMLPSLRFKEDKSAIKSSVVTPTLGAGFTYLYKRLAIQVPFYYNGKTSTANGKWNVGIGIGTRVNYDKPKK